MFKKTTSKVIVRLLYIINYHCRKCLYAEGFLLLIFYIKFLLYSA